MEIFMDIVGNFADIYCDLMEFYGDLIGISWEFIHQNEDVMVIYWWGKRMTLIKMNANVISLKSIRWESYHGKCLALASKMVITGKRSAFIGI